MSKSIFNTPKKPFSNTIFLFCNHFLFKGTYFIFMRHPHYYPHYYYFKFIGDVRSINVTLTAVYIVLRFMWRNPGRALAHLRNTYLSSHTCIVCYPEVHHPQRVEIYMKTRQSSTNVLSPNSSIGPLPFYMISNFKIPHGIRF